MMIHSRFGLMLAVAWVVATIAHAGPIEDAVTLYDDGKYPEAHAALQGVLAGSPNASEAARARYYDALALFEMEKYDDCIEAVGKAWQQSAELTPEQRSGLDSKLVRAHYAQKNFEDTRREAQAFLQTHGATAGTTETKYMRFINTKAMWDLARKDYIDATKARERGRDDGALTANGAARMQQFLAECNDFTAQERAEFVVSRKMSLDQMKWHARILAGEEEQLATEMQSVSAKEQTDFAYYRAWAHYYFWPENRMENHDMMKAFAEAHPESEWAPRARYFAARCLHGKAIELGQELRNLRYESRKTAATKIHQELTSIMNQFVEECRDGEHMGAFSLKPDGETDIGQKYLEICSMMREQEVSEIDLDDLTPENRAQSEFSAALGLYGTAGPEEWEEALARMSQCAANQDVPELQRKAVDYCHRIKYEHAIYSFRQAYVLHQGTDSEQTTATAEYLLGMSLFNQCIADYDSALANDLLPADTVSRRHMEERYWESRFAIDSGEALLEESAAWEPARQDRLMFNQVHAYYHTNQWERFRQAAVQYLEITNIPEDDLLDVEQDLFASYEYTGEYDRLVEAADIVLARYAAGTKGWARTMTARAIGKIMKSERDPQGAAEDLDQVLASNIEDSNLLDHVPTRAAYWRAYVAEVVDDSDKLRETARMIRDDMPDNPFRTTALSRFEAALQ